MVAWIAALICAGRRPARTGLEWPIAAWLAAAGLSMCVTPDVGASISGLRKIVKVTVFALAVAGTVRTRARLLALLGAAAAGAAIVALDGLWQVVTGADVFGVLPGDAPGGLRRLTALYPHANHFAIHGLVVLPAFPVLMWHARHAWQRRAAAIGLGVVIPAWWMTYSRPGLLGLAAMALVWLVAARAWRAAAACVAAGAAAVLLIPPSVRAWIAAQPSWFDALVQPLRKEIWHAAWGMIQASPWIGLGVNTFLQHFNRFKLPTDLQAPAYAHNNVLHMGAEIGAIGVAAFAWLLWRIAQAAWRLLRHPDPAVRDAALAMACGAAAFLGIGLLESDLYSARSYVPFWLWVGALCAPALREPAKA